MNEGDMRDWESDTEETRSGWFWAEVSLAAMVVIAGYVALGRAAIGWLMEYLQ